MRKFSPSPVLHVMGTMSNVNVMCQISHVKRHIKIGAVSLWKEFDQRGLTGLVLFQKARFSHKSCYATNLVIKDFGDQIFFSTKKLSKTIYLYFFLMFQQKKVFPKILVSPNLFSIFFVVVTIHVCHKTFLDYPFL